MVLLKPVGSKRRWLASNKCARSTADAMLEAGDLDGAATWRRILGAVKQLQSRKPAGTVH